MLARIQDVELRPLRYQHPFCGDSPIHVLSWRPARVAETDPIACVIRRFQPGSRESALGVRLIDPRDFDVGAVAVLSLPIVLSGLDVPDDLTLPPSDYKRRSRDRHRQQRDNHRQRIDRRFHDDRRDLLSEHDRHCYAQPIK